MATLDATHEASASATGYLFQCRYALLAALKAIPDTPQLSISIEKFDDVAFESAGEPIEQIQLKHHKSKAGNLTDASVDLWKTLQIWSKHVAREPDAPFRTRFLLLTTAMAPDGSAASLLRANGRDEQEVDKRLLKTISKSKNQENAAAYAAYKALSDQLRLSLLRATLVLDCSSNINDVRDEIARQLYHAAGRKQIDGLVERLEGWWFNVIIRALSGSGQTSIPILSVDRRIDELREEFKRHALPVDLKTKCPSPEIVAALDKWPFVRQLRKIEIGEKRIEYAMRDYYRAYEQRSRWAREDLLLDGELDAYEQELVEAWEPRFAAMLDELGSLSRLEEKVTQGQLLFKWVEQQAEFPLRSVRERFLTHGSYHILSNRYAVGWHPDFSSDDEKEA